MNSTTRVSSIGSIVARMHNVNQSRPASPKGVAESFEIYKNNLIKKMKDPEQAKADNYNLIRCKVSGNVAVDPVISPEGIIYRREFLLRWLEQEDRSPITREPMHLFYKDDEPYIHYKGCDFYAGRNQELMDLIESYVINDEGLSNEVKQMFTIDNYLLAVPELTDDVSTHKFYGNRSVTRRECLLEAIDLAENDAIGVYSSAKKALPYLNLARLLEPEEVVTLKNNSQVNQLSLLLTANEFDPDNSEISEFLDSLPL